MLSDDDIEAPPQPGILDSLRSMLATATQLVHTRVELFTTELEEEMYRIATLLLWAIVAIFFGGLCVLMLSLTIIIALWDDHRVLAAVIMTGLFLCVVTFASLKLNGVLKVRSRLLAASIDELHRDKQALSGRVPGVRP